MAETKTYLKETPPVGTSVWEGDIMRVSVGDESNDYYTYTSDEKHLTVHKGGSLSLSDKYGESILFFYPDELKYLKLALDKAMQLTQEAVA